ncbi:MAG: MATE family efflux transporter [Cyanobacteria bacterium J06638_28]
MIEARALLRLAMPLALIQVAEGTVNFLDTLMMGWLGTSALAAGGLGAIIFWTFLSLFTGLLEMTGALAAEAYGAGNPQRVSSINSQALWLSLGVSVPTLILFWHLDRVLLFFGQDPQIVAQCMTYLRAIMWGLPAALGIFVFKEMTTALMQPRLLTLLMVGSIPANFVLNYILMYGVGWLPPLGLAGIGWSSTIVFWTLFVVTIICLQRQPALQPWQLFKNIGHFERPVLQEILYLGWPLCVDYGTEFGALTVAALLMGTWGTQFLAAHRIVITTTEILLMFSWGLSYAAAMLTAHQIGANRPDLARRILTVGMGMNCVLAAILAVPLWLFPQLIVGLYIDPSVVTSQGIVEGAIALLKIGVIFQVIQGFRLMSLGTLQGLRDTYFLAGVDFLAHWVVGLGIGYILGEYWQLQGIGLWWGLTIGQITAAIFLGARVYQLLRRKINHLPESK